MQSLRPSAASGKPKMLLKTQIFEEKKAIFPVKKRFWPIFHRFINYEKCLKTIFKDRKGLLTVTVEVKRSFPRELRGR